MGLDLVGIQKCQLMMLCRRSTHSLTQDKTLEERTTIPVPGPDICALTELCLRFTYFVFGDTLFNQVEGAAMGLPLSPIVTNLFMEAFKDRVLESAALQPRMWVRYVDDMFVLWPHKEDKLETSQLTAPINSVHNGEGE